MVQIQTLKGFRDFLPSEIRKRQFVLNTLKKVFESYGFEPLETPSLEYEEILTEKYGTEANKLMYKFEDQGGRKVALRYDQTVPLARVIASYQNNLPMPFKRYQIQNVWRAENTQKGRYREFLQVDADIVGTYSPLADAEVLSVVYNSFKNLGLKIKILINDRKNLSNIENKYLSSIDKVGKISEEEIIKEMGSKGMAVDQAEKTFNEVLNKEEPDSVKEIKSVFEKLGNPKDILQYRSVLVRGLDYYTGLIFEVILDSDNPQALGGGGRFDNLIGMFAGKDIPAVGFSFGFDRIIEATEKLKLFPDTLGSKSVFVAFSKPELQEKALEISSHLRNKDINSQYYLEEADLEKQLKYADKIQAFYTIIVEKENLILKDMAKRTQENLTLPEIIKKLS